MDEIPEGLEDLLKDILGDEKPKKNSSALAVIPKAEKKEEDVVDEQIDERILRLLGLEGVTDIDYATYKSLLREKVAAARMSGSTMATDETELITNEFKRVKNLTGRFKVKQKKVKAEKVFSTAITKTSRPTKQEDDIPAGLDALLDSIKKEKDQKELKKEDKEETAIQFIRNTIAPSLTKIEKNLESILDTLTKQFQFDKKKSEKAADEAQTARKKAREDKLEGGVAKSEKNITEKVIAPVKGLFDSIMDFFKNILLGGALLWVLNFIKDPAKAIQPFIDAINGVINFINEIIKTVFNFVISPINQIITSVYDGLSNLEAQMNKLLTLLGQQPLNNFPAGQAPVIQMPTWMQIPEVQNPFAPPPAQSSAPPAAQAPGMQGGGLVSSNTGSKISGMGVDTQLVALQPGEVVMSRPAVNAYGAGNLLAMNKAAGGTNMPKMGNIMGMQGGGLVSDVTFSAGHFSTGFKNGIPVGSDGRPVQGTADSNEGSSRYKRGGALYGMDPTGVAEYQATTHLINTMQGLVSGTPLASVIKFRNIGTWAGMSSIPRQVESNPGSQFIDLHFDARGYGKAGVLPGGNESPVDRALMGSYGRYYSDGYRPSKAVTNAGGTLLEMASIDDPSVRPYLMEVKNGQTGPASLAMAKKLLLSTLTGIKGGEDMKQYVGGTKSTTPASILQPTPTNNNNGSRNPNATVAPPSTTTTTPAPPVKPTTNVIVQPIPTQRPRKRSAPSSGSFGSQSQVPNISPIDSGNTELMVIKAIYNIVG